MLPVPFLLSLILLLLLLQYKYHGVGTQDRPLEHLLVEGAPVEAAAGLRCGRRRQGAGSPRQPGGATLGKGSLTAASQSDFHGSEAGG